MRATLGSLFLLAGIVGLRFFTSQEDFLKILSFFTIAFIGYGMLLIHTHNTFVRLLGVALVARVLLVFSFPTLSDDIYRFIWDGSLSINGLNPYLYLPNEVLNVNGQLSQPLFDALNSKDYYTVYPPISQFVFGLSVKLFPDSIELATMTIKVILLIAELGVIAMLYRLLKFYSMDINLLFIYALNPLVIVEVMGNAHFESMMLFLFLSSVALLLFRSSAIFVLLAGFLFALSIGVKLHTAMFAPLLILIVGIKKSVPFALGLMLGLIVIFYPFMDFSESGIIESLDLYFRNFEFNASLYYLVRWFGYKYSGYNMIQYIGPMLSGVSVLIMAVILILAILNKKTRGTPFIFCYMLFVFIVFLICSTTIHPWYLIMPIGLTVFTSYRFVILWSWAVIWSYAHYWNGNFVENYWLISFEYLLVFCYCIYEIKRSMPILLTRYIPIETTIEN